MRKIILMMVLSILFTTSYAQEYQTAIGIKGGSFGWGGGALNLKHFLGGTNAVELSIGGSANSLYVQGLYEWQNSTGWTPGLDWYIGLGASAGSWCSNALGGNWGNHKYNSGFFIGADGIIGLDYTFSEIPLNIALDMGPHIGLINSMRFGWIGGFAIRYVLQ